MTHHRQFYKIIYLPKESLESSGNFIIREMIVGEQRTATAVRAQKVWWSVIIHTDHLGNCLLSAQLSVCLDRDAKRTLKRLCSAGWPLENGNFISFYCCPLLDCCLPVASGVLSASIIGNSLFTIQVKVVKEVSHQTVKSHIGEIGEVIRFGLVV